MEQIQTFSDSRLDGICAYCGDGNPKTRDHVPSKILLEKPYPDNLPVVPACLSCNQGFSLDEEYFACLLECVIHGTTDIDKLSRNRIKKILTRKKNLWTRLEKAKTENLFGEIEFLTENKRIKNVILKLAFGHARYENSETQFEDPASIWFLPINLMKEEDLETFLSPEEISTLPEIGSRAFQRIAFNDERTPASYWKEVQPNAYVYTITHISGGLGVRMIIWNYLACEVFWN